MIEESQNIEHKESWRDEYLKWICGFANAQGGRVYIGVDDDRQVTGVDGKTDHVNELLRASFDYCVPSIATSTEYMEVTDEEGKLNHIILMSIPQSMSGAAR